MLKHITAIAGILICTSIAWFILGNTVATRTQESGSSLKPGVASIWGSSQEQRPPVASFRASDLAPVQEIKPASSQIQVNLNLDYRQKGLLWYSTYVVDFSGEYEFRNETEEARQVTYRMSFPGEHAVYDGVVLEINGKATPFVADSHGTAAEMMLKAGESAHVKVAYRSRGLDSWQYRFGSEVTQAKNFALTMHTNFKDIDFPADGLSPTAKHETRNGWELTWRYASLISGYQIGMKMPEKLQPGPIAGEISYFAPVSLLMFFFLLFIITTLRNIELHPMNYFFLAAAFFAFHLLFAYLVDHIQIHLAFAICSAVSIFLVVSYLRLITGLRFAVVEAGIAQLVYLVLFSYTFFFKGYSGLTAAVGCVITLYVVMQMTGKVRWAGRFAVDNGGGTMLHK